MLLAVRGSRGQVLGEAVLGEELAADFIRFMYGGDGFKGCSNKRLYDAVFCMF